MDGHRNTADRLGNGAVRRLSSVGKNSIVCRWGDAVDRQLGTVVVSRIGSRCCGSYRTAALNISRLDDARLRSLRFKKSWGDRYGWRHHCMWVLLGDPAMTIWLTRRFCETKVGIGRRTATIERENPRYSDSGYGHR